MHAEQKTGHAEKLRIGLWHKNTKSIHKPCTLLKTTEKHQKRQSSSPSTTHTQSYLEVDELDAFCDAIKLPTDEVRVFASAAGHAEVRAFTIFTIHPNAVKQKIRNLWCVETIHVDGPVQG